MNNTKFYKKYLMSPGLVRFNTDKEEIILLEKEMIDNNLNTLKQKPVVIGHDGELTVGEVVDCYFDIDKGYYIVGFNVWDDEAKNLLDNKQFSVSSTYEVVNKTDAVEKYHNMDYNYRVNSLDFINLAIVEKPRYQETKVYVNSLDGEEDIKENGGPGSGNFGHAGRPGKRGGSSSYGSRSYEELSSIVAKKKEQSLKTGGKLFEAIRQKAQERISKDLDLKKRVDEYLNKRKEKDNIKQKDIQDKESIDIEKGDKAPIQEKEPIQRKYDYSIEELEKEANERKLKRYQDYLEFRKQYEQDNTHTQAEFDLYRSGEKKLKRIEEELKTNPNLSDIEKAKLFNMFDTEYKKMKQDPQKIEERKQKREDKYQEQQEKIKSGDYSIANFGLKRLPGTKQFEEQLGTGAVYKPNKSFWNEYKNNLEKMKEHFIVRKTFDGNWVVMEKSDKQPIQETKQETPIKEESKKESKKKIEYLTGEEQKQIKQAFDNPYRKDYNNPENVKLRKELADKMDLEKLTNQFQKTLEKSFVPKELLNEEQLNNLNDMNKMKLSDYLSGQEYNRNTHVFERALLEKISGGDNDFRKLEPLAKEYIQDYYLKGKKHIQEKKPEKDTYEKDFDKDVSQKDIKRVMEDYRGYDDTWKTREDLKMKAEEVINRVSDKAIDNVFKKHIKPYIKNTEKIEKGDLRFTDYEFLKTPTWKFFEAVLIKKYGKEKAMNVFLDMFNKSVANNK